MIGRNKYARFSAGILASLGLCIIGGEASAQQAATTSPEAAANITVKSMTTQVYKAVDQPKLPQRREGAGAQNGSGVVTSIGGKQQIFSVFTESRAKPNTNRQDRQGAFLVSALAADGSLATVVPVTPFARRIGNNQERNFMKPQINAVGKLANGDTANVVTLISTEQNGDNANLGDLTGLSAQDVINQSNGNPQVIALVQDPATGKLKKEYNIITLLLKSIGQNNDQQQWGTPEIAEGPDGLVGVSFQRNNQTCWFGVMQVNADGTIDAKSLIKNENQCQHGKPTANFIPGTAVGSAGTWETTHVEGDQQPTEIGIRTDLIAYDGTKGPQALKKAASRLIAKSVIVDKNDMRKNQYAAQPSAAVYMGATGPIIAVTYAMANPAKANKTNGHAGASNITNVVTLDAKLAELDHKDSGTVILGGARHARAMALSFGEVSDTVTTGNPAIGIMAGSSYGTGAAGLNVLTLDRTTGKIAAATRDKVFTIANNSDIAGLPTQGSTNAQDQSCGFLTMVKGSLLNTSSKYPEVKTFSVTLVNGPDNPLTSTRDSMYLSLVPQTWAAGVKVNPGGATTPDQVPSGPTPTTTTAPASTPTPVDPSNGDTTIGSGGGESDPVSSGGSKGTTRTSAESGGCSVSANGTGNSNNDVGGIALLGLGLALVAARRNGSKKEA